MTNHDEAPGGHRADDLPGVGVPAEVPVNQLNYGDVIQQAEDVIQAEREELPQAVPDEPVELVDAPVRAVPPTGRSDRRSRRRGRS